MPAEARCKSCGATVLWARLASGKLAPINPTPCPDGNVQLFRRPDGTVYGLVLAKDQRPPGAIMRKSHFADCPAADEFRKARQILEER